MVPDEERLWIAKCSYKLCMAGRISLLTCWWMMAAAKYFSVWWFWMRYG